MATIYHASNPIVGFEADRPQANNVEGGVKHPHAAMFIALDTGNVYRPSGQTWTLVGTMASAGFAGALKSTSTSTPTAAAGVNAGTSPPAPVIVTGSNDVAGSITFGSGSGSPATGDYVDVTFGTAYAAIPKAVLVLPLNAATMAKAPLGVTALSTAGFSVSMQTAAATSQAATVYGFYYLVVA